MGCLIWADDLLLLSKTELGLNNMLKTLKVYTEANGMTLSTEKTKVMIFNSRGRHMRRVFFFGDKQIETTRQYKYLGFLVTPSGEINTGLKDLKDRAQRAFYSMKFKLGSAFQKNPLITIKLFNALVKPILLYASDFWGALKLPHNNPVENLHLSFCKQLLGVQKQTTNVGVLLELGQIPLSVYAKKFAFKNWERISNRSNCNKMVIMSYENAVSLKLTWPTRIQSLLSEIGMLENFILRVVNTHNKAFQRMSDIFHQNAFSKINDINNKLRSYSIIKSKIGYEEYLHNIRNVHDRVAFTKLRLSNHRLQIEVGRHNNIPKNLRFCQFCPTHIEGEIHFLLECETLHNLRKELIRSIPEEADHFTYLSKIGKFCALMNNQFIVSKTAQYIAKMLELREYLLKTHKNHL